MLREPDAEIFSLLRAADAEAAEHEMQWFLTCLHFMWRLALRAKRAG